MSKEPSFIKIEDVKVLHAKKHGAAAAGTGAKPIRIPAEWTWHYGVLHALRDRLLKDRGDELAAAAEAIEPHSMDDADSATDEIDHDIALTLLSHEQNELYEIDSAIRRILDGTYGICEETGRPIPEARLRAIPWARYTEEVQERLEKEGMGERVRLPQAESARDSAPAAIAESVVPDGDMQDLESRRRTTDRAVQARETEEAEEELLTRQPEEPSPDEVRGRMPPVPPSAPITPPPRRRISKPTSRRKASPKTALKGKKIAAKTKSKARPAKAKPGRSRAAVRKPKVKARRPTRKPARSSARKPRASRVSKPKARRRKSSRR